MGNQILMVPNHREPELLVRCVVEAVPAVRRTGACIGTTKGVALLCVGRNEGKGSAGGWVVAGA